MGFLGLELSLEARVGFGEARVLGLEARAFLQGPGVRGALRFVHRQGFLVARVPFRGLTVGGLRGVEGGRCLGEFGPRAREGLCQSVWVALGALGRLGRGLSLQALELLLEPRSFRE